MSTMIEDQAAELVARLDSAGVHSELGLSAAELDEVETRFGFEFCDEPALAGLATMIQIGSAPGPAVWQPVPSRRTGPSMAGDLGASN